MQELCTFFVSTERDKTKFWALRLLKDYFADLFSKACMGIEACLIAYEVKRDHNLVIETRRSESNRMDSVACHSNPTAKL